VIFTDHYGIVGHLYGNFVVLPFWRLEFRGGS
jgi:hypothetical protein